MPLTKTTAEVLTTVISDATDDLKVLIDIPTAETALDAKLNALIERAYYLVQAYQWRQLIDATFLLTTENFCSWWRRDTVYLPNPPVTDVTQIQYYDTSDNLQTLATTEYTKELTSTEPPYVWFELPTESLSDDRDFPVQITYTAGYGTAWSDLPKTTQTAILQQAYHEWLGGPCSSLGESARTYADMEKFRSERTGEYL